MNFDANWQKAATQMQEAFKGMVTQLPGRPQGAQNAPIQFDNANDNDIIEPIERSNVPVVSGMRNASASTATITFSVSTNFSVVLLKNVFDRRSPNTTMKAPQR